MPTGGSRLGLGEPQPSMAARVRPQTADRRPDKARRSCTRPPGARPHKHESNAVEGLPRSAPCGGGGRRDRQQLSTGGTPIACVCSDASQRHGMAGRSTRVSSVWTRAGTGGQPSRWSPGESSRNTRTPPASGHLTGAGGGMPRQLTPVRMVKTSGHRDGCSDAAVLFDPCLG